MTVVQTGAMMGERGARVREVRRRLAQDGPPWTRDHERDFQTVSIPERDCDLIRDLLISERVATVVEIGLAYASSALAIGEALVTVGPPHARHVIIDPFQEDAYADVGWDLLRTAGLDPIAELVRAWSSIALPRLVTEGLVADAAFVDGSHRFHEVFVDLYFLRKIVRPGGLIVVDDDWTPSVRTAVRYYEQNLGWTIGDDPAAVAVPRCRALRLQDAGAVAGSSPGVVGGSAMPMKFPPMGRMPTDHPSAVRSSVRV